MQPYDWRKALLKYGRAALFGAALLAVYDQNLIAHLQAGTPETYRAIVDMLLVAGLPALRNLLKVKFGLTFGGVL